MTRTGYDAIRSLAHNIPANAQIVMGYIDHTDPWTATEWGRFPSATKVRIARGAGTNDGHAGDCEPGCMWPPSQLVSWVRLRRSAGADPTGYCSTGNWAACRAAFAAAREPEPHWWVAAYPGGGAIIPAGAVAHQYMDAGIYDKSVVADYWPGVDGGGDMELTDSIGVNTAGATITVQDVLRLLYNALADSKAAPQGQTLYDALWQVRDLATAEGTQVTAEQAALLAAIQAQPTGGQVDVNQLAAALAPVLARLLPADATPEQVADAVRAELATVLAVQPPSTS